MRALPLAHIVGCGEQVVNGDIHMKGGDSIETAKKNLTKRTQVESLLLQKLMGVVRMFIQIVNMSLQISKLKKEVKAVRHSFTCGSNSVGRVPAFQGPRRKKGLF